MTTTRRGVLTLRLLSDTCFSMPSTAETIVDSAVATDELGLPRVSGKTLRGLLRDTWLAAAPLDPDYKLGRALFGFEGGHTDAVQGIVRIGDGHVTDALRAWVRWAVKRDGKENPLSIGAIREAFYRIRTQTAQDRATGAPKPETLRTMRVIPEGIEMSAPFSVHGPLDDEQEALFETLACLTRHAGLDRNRGPGHIELRVKWEDVSKIADGADENSAPPPPEPEIGALLPSEPTRPADATVFLHYRLTLTAPCILTATLLDANSRGTYSYLPGPSLRGAVARLANDTGRPHILQQAILSGRVRFLHAYPEPKDHRQLRAFPCPITWKKDKAPPFHADDEGKDYQEGANPRESLSDLLSSEGQFTGEPEDNDEESPALLPQTKELASAFFTGRGSFVPAEAEKRSTTHQRRDRKTGATRKEDNTEEQATVFVYEALEAGQSFRGCIALPESERQAAQEWLRLLEEETLLFGRSALGGYGGAARLTFLSGADAGDFRNELGMACIEIGPSDPGPGMTMPGYDGDSGWQSDGFEDDPEDYEADTGETDGDNHDAPLADGKPSLSEPETLTAAFFALRLTSDAVLRDPDTGQHDPYALRALVETRIPEAEVLEVAIEIGTARGFNRMWRNELPAVATAAAGSCVLLRTAVMLSAERVCEIQSQTLGERVEDGFGCFVLAREIAGSLTLHKPDSTPAAAPNGLLEPDALKAMQKRLYRERIRLVVGRQALTDAESATQLPSPSLLHRMRIPLNGESNWRMQYAEWMNLEDPQSKGSKALRPAARRPLERCLLALPDVNKNDGAASRDAGQKKTDITLLDLLRTVAAGGTPPKGDTEAQRLLEIPHEFRIVGAEMAQQIWSETEQEAAVFYLDTLLSRMARRAKTARPEGGPS